MNHASHIKAVDAAQGGPPGGRRPARLGLALGSGVARGWAHIGILRALAEAGVVPSVVTGCSIGALVGGCHAAGKLDEIEEFARALTKRRILGLLDFQIQGGGLIAGRRLAALLLRTLGDSRIEDLPVRFAAVATEIESGHEVWLDRGGLGDAIRASCAIPGVFEPLRSEGRTLVDGALVNPIPVTLARALGADLVVCVDLNGDARLRGTVIPSHAVRPQPGPGAGRVDGASAWRWWRFQSRRDAPAEHGDPGFRPARAVSVLADALNIAQDRIARSRLAGDPPDLVVAPRLSGVGLFEFNRAAETIDLGRRAAERVLPDILDAIEARGRTLRER